MKIWTKIGNKQFSDADVLSLKLVVNKRIENFNELFPQNIGNDELEVKKNSISISI